MKKILSLQDDIFESEVGGKFAKQAKMYKKKINVPEFVCLTTELFNQFSINYISEIKALLNKIDFTSSKDIQSKSESIQKILSNAPMTVEMEEMILREVKSKLGDCELFSVRASTVAKSESESEDSVENPFAGMSESFLYVKYDEILKKVKRCFASGFSYESLIYRNEQGFDLFGFKVAVGIQKMIFGKRSFVMFTSNPQNALNETVLVGGYGIGEGVVQERVEVDHYFYNNETKTIKKQIVKKTSELVFDAKNGSGLTSKEVAADLENEAVFTDNEISEIAKIGLEIKSIFGMPQDIEGTIDEFGKIHILQSRPISFDFTKQRIWSNANITESFPGTTTPLTYSFARYFYRVIFFDLYRLTAVDGDRLHRHHEQLDKMIGYINGSIYYSLTSFYQLHSLGPLWPLFKKKWEKMIGITSFNAVKESSYQSLSSFNKNLGVITGVIRLMYFWKKHDRDMTKFYNWWEDHFAPKRGKSFSRVDPMDIEHQFYDTWTQVGDQWGVTLTNDIFIMLPFGVLEGLFKKLGLTKKHPALLSDLLCGDEKLQSVEILLSGVSLAERIRNDESLNKLFMDGDEKDVWNKIKNFEFEESFCQAFKLHIHLYGDRGLQELILENKTLREEPWQLVGLVRNFVKTDISEKEVRENEIKIRLAADKILNKELKFRPITKYFINRLLRALRVSIRNRENSRYCRSELFGLSKAYFKGIGSYFNNRNILKEQNDIFYLTQDEIFGFIDGTGVTNNIQGIVDIRKEEFIENEKKEIPEQITTIGALRDNNLTPIDSDDDLKDGELKGLGSSAGLIKGRAMVVIDPKEIENLPSDTILIARETDPGWLFLMLASKGIIVERGSMLSHTAITGRKFGIPTIVSLKDITKIIKTGDLIEMDGSTGLVRILENA